MKVFVSATSTDLRAYREAVKDVLLQANIQPVTQEVLSADHRNLPEFLDSLVISCDAVVCLVGKVFGAAPEDTPNRSYTQLEYDCAKKMGKPIFVYMAGEEVYADPESQQSQEETEWQHEHCQSLLNESYCRSFGSLLELEKEVGVSVSTIQRAGGQIPMQYFHLPAKAQFFVGRQEERAQLHKAISARRPGIIAVTGMAGQGKTTLVHHVIDGRQEDAAFPFHAGFWGNAGQGEFTFDTFLDEAIACLTDGDFDKAEAPKTQQRVQRLLSELQRRPILVVIDQIERWLRGWESGDADGDDITEQDRLAGCDGLDDFLTQATGLTNGSHVLITSRAMPAVLEDFDKVVIPVREAAENDVGLDGLKPADAVDVLRQFNLEASDEELESFAGYLGFHPLALCVFGAYVEKRYGGVLDDANILKKWDRRKTLAKLFDDVIQRIPGGNTSRRFLEAASCAIEDAPLEALETAMKFSPTDESEFDARDSALMLADWKVIAFHARSGVVSMHALLKEHIGKGFSDAERSAIHNRFSEWYNAQALPPKPATLIDANTRLLALRHAIAAEEETLCQQILWGKITPLYSFVEWLGACGHFVFGVELLSDLSSASDDQLRASVLIARSVFQRPLGELNAACSDLDEAIQILQAQEIRDEPGFDAPKLAGALSNRGTILMELVRYSESLADFDSAVALLQSQPDGDEKAFQLASTRANRAMCLRESGQMRKAIEDCTAAIDTHRDRLEPIYQRLNPDLSSAFVNRGNVFKDLRCGKKAIEDYDGAIAIQSTLVDIGQLQFRGPLALSHVMRGYALLNLQHHEQAIEEFDEALETLRDLVRSGKKHFKPTMALGLMLRALSLVANRNTGDALKDSETALAIHQEHVQAGRKELCGSHAHSMLIHALVQYRSGDQERGKALWQEAIARTVELIGNGETDLRMIIVRYSIELSLAIIDDDAFATSLIDKALGVAEVITGNGPRSEGLEAETRYAINLLRDRASSHVRAADWERIENLEAWLSRSPGISEERD